MSEKSKDEFQEAANESEIGLGREIWDMLSKRKKWWLLPILIALALIGVLLVLGSTSAAPFIYTLF
jgi:drug/metabolite transporter superfamily protein YnfA